MKTQDAVFSTREHQHRIGRGSIPGRSTNELKLVLRAGVFLAALALTCSASAKSLTWTGGAGTAYWSYTANWGFQGVPADGDFLTFPAAASRLTNTNDLPDLHVASITFGPGGVNYAIYGNSLTISNGIALLYTSGTNHFHPNLTLGNSQDFDFYSGGFGAAFYHYGDIDLGMHTLRVVNFGFVLLGGSISGNGGLQKEHMGTLTLGTLATTSGGRPNSYRGSTYVYGGVLELDKKHWQPPHPPFPGVTVADTAVAGNLTVGSFYGSSGVLRLLFGDQIADSSHVTISPVGLLDLNGYSEVISNLTMEGGTINTGTGTLTLGGDVAVATAQAVINGNLDLGSATRTFTVADPNPAWDLIINANITGGPVSPGVAMRKLGSGQILLQGNNTFTGEVVLDEGEISVFSNTALGGTADGITVNSNACLVLDNGVNIGAERLILNSTCTAGALKAYHGPDAFAGNIELRIPVFIGVHTDLALNGAISGPGGFTKIGPASLALSGGLANTYGGTTRVNEGMLMLNKSILSAAVPGTLVVGDGVGGVDADAVRIMNNPQINGYAAVIVNSSGLIDWSSDGGEAIGSLAGSGHVELGGASLDTGYNNQPTIFSGVISGTGGTLAKRGTNIFTLTGPNTYSGGTYVGGGTLLVNGSQPLSPVEVASAGTLGGVGTVGAIYAYGNLAPGTSPGMLTSSNLTFAPGGDFFVELAGPLPSTGYDQMAVRGTVALSNATLHVNPAFTTPVQIGDRFTIINNDGAEVIPDTFNGLANGATFYVNGYGFRISYNGGTGNDVVLTAADMPLGQVASAVTTGNGNRAIDPNECNHLDIVITNKSGRPMTGVAASLSAQAGTAALVSQSFSAYPDLPPFGIATNTTPFQLATLPALPCGADIYLNLMVASASHGSFVVPVVLHSGEPSSSPHRYDVTGDLPIPDVGTVESSNTVSGFYAGPLTKVVVSMFLTHGYVADLSVSLLAPDNTWVDLTSGNGGSGNDYGSSCADADRTTFDDAAAAPITSGVAPFAGTFRPEGALAAFIGKTGSAVNGAWRLRITDTSGGTFGTLRCWSLLLYPVECASGGGYCDTCPGAFSGAITTNDLVQVGRLYRDGLASSCGDVKACPGLYDSLPRHYDAYMFTNTGGPACVTVALDVPGATANELSASAYLGSYDPDNLCLNYLGDLGSSPPALNSFSVNVPADATLVVVVNEIIPNVGCTNYTLIASGLPCPPLTLAVDGSTLTNGVRLHWPTWAAGYKLEATPALNPTSSWGWITNDPIVSAGRYHVTNSTLAPSNQFYRLHKP